MIFLLSTSSEEIDRLVIIIGEFTYLCHPNTDMDWAVTARRALRIGDMELLWMSVEQLINEGKEEVILPYVIEYSGYQYHPQLPVKPNKELLDVAGYIIERYDDATDLSMYAVDLGNVDMLGFIVDRDYDQIDMGELRSYITKNRKRYLLPVLE